MERKHSFLVTVETDDDTGELQAAYIRVRQGEVSKTIEIAEGRANADFDSSGELLGIELLAPCDIQVLLQIVINESDSVRRFVKDSPPRGFVLASSCP